MHRSYVCASRCAPALALLVAFGQGVAAGQTTDVRTRDRLRGFSDDELAAAKQATPPRPDPPLGTPIPRRVHVTGRVHVDANANGALDPGEPGLARVLVTNGQDVTRTASDGGYAFQFEIGRETHCRFVVVTRPTGYRPTGPYFLRIPFAEERTTYRADFGFAECPHARRREFWFIVTSDSQFTRPEEMIPTAKDYAQMTDTPGDPAFLLTVGDLTMSGTHYQWDMYDRIRGASKIRVYDVFGGHDGNCLTPRGTAHYEFRIGPPYYSWDYGGVHFVQFVTELHYLTPAARARQQAWLAADLRAIPKGSPVIVATHYPLPGEWFDRRRAEGVKVLCQLAGHWHVVQAGSRGGVPVLISAPARGQDWGAYSRAYRWVHVTPQGVRTELRIAGQYQRLEVIAPGLTARLGPGPLMVLAYDSARKIRSVTCRAIAPDGRSRSPGLTQKGDWSWHGTFAPDVAGDWRFELEATDSTGAVWKRRQSIRVVNARPTAPRLGDDFGWLLAGRPPRRISRGPGAPLYPLWIRHAGSVHVLHASPVVAGGRLYVAVTNPNAGAPGSGVLCVDAKTGTEIWRARTPLGDIRGPVTVHEGRVFAVSGEGWIAAFDAMTGRSLWARPLKPEYQLGRPLAIIQTPPAPTPLGLLVSDWQSPQFLLGATTGRQIAQIDGNVGTYVAFATAYDGVMYAARRGGAMAVQLPSGKQAWSVEEKARSTSAGIVVDGRYLYTASSAVKALDAATGKLRWQTAVPNVGRRNPIPVVWDDIVLVNGTDLTAVDLGTGKQRWVVKCAREPNRFERSRRQAMAGSSTPIVAGTLAYVGHDDTSIRAVRRDGTVLWEHRFGTPVKTDPVVSGNLLFVHDYAGNLWCFGPAAD